MLLIRLVSMSRAMNYIPLPRGEAKENVHKVFDDVRARGSLRACGRIQRERRSGASPCRSPTCIGRGERADNRSRLRQPLRPAPHARARDDASDI